jgi:hypothetical protein
MALPKTRITMDIPKDITRRLRVLKGAKGNEIMRNSLKATQRPPIKSMKGMVRRHRTQSTQSTGATLRSIKNKVSFPGKTTPGRGYMLAGIDFEYFEHHMKNSDDLHKRSGFKRRRRFVGVTNRGRRAKGRNQRLTKKYVQSYQKRSLRLYKGQKAQKNRPGKYWHILESGWTNRKTRTRWKGYKFVQKAFKDTERQMYASFFRVLQNGIEREFKR